MESEIEQKPNILVIDDDMALCRVICDALKHKGFNASFCTNLKAGLKKAGSDAVDVVLLDVHLPDGNGIDKIPKISTAPTQPEVIIITGNAEPDSAELAINSGAWDYIQKPISIKKIILQLTRVLEYREKKLSSSSRKFLNRDGIIGNSLPLRSSLIQLGNASGTEASVLLTGETGTGKELFARALHQNSLRAESNFVVVDCAALPTTLVESVLFGHEKGAFTGADKRREGLVKLADGGTLFLDEVGEMPLSLQKVFLRVLENKRYRPIGHNNEVYSNFRMVSATNRDLDEMVRKGRFRSDLLFRLRAFSIELPPLRNRKDDIRELATDYISRRCNYYNIEQKGFSPDFFESLLLYDWPGNVRELNQALDMAIAEAQQEPILFARHLPAYLRAQIVRQRTAAGPITKTLKDIPVAESSPQKINEDLQELRTYREYRQAVLDDAERSYLISLMKVTHGNMKQARIQSGLGRTRLYTILKKHNIV